MFVTGANLVEVRHAYMEFSHCECLVFGGITIVQNNATFEPHSLHQCLI